MDHDKITVTMSKIEFEVTLNALAQLPFSQVNNLLVSLVNQANDQRSEAQEPLDLNPGESTPPVS